MGKNRFKGFFSIYYPELTSFASRYIANLYVCEHIVQDIFISFWEKQKNFPNIYAVKAFIYKSTRNSCLDYLKHSKVEEKYRELNKSEDEPMESFLEEVIRLEAYSEIYSEINKLPEMGKKVLLLSLRENSNEEIAKILAIAINTVKTHKARAYKVLRKNLGGLFLFFAPFRKQYIHRGELIEKTKTAFGWILEIVLRSDHSSQFAVIPKRWVVESTFAWFERYRRLSKDFEYLTDTSEAMIQFEMIKLMLDRIQKSILNSF